MNLQKTFITKNDCYKAGRTITPKGIMVHSTATPGVMAQSWFSRWNRADLAVAVHAFVDDTVVCQHLPWNHRAWHCADSGNNTHIAFEMCEPSDWKTNKEYFVACYKNAVELAAHLCRIYNLTVKNIISHKEGHQQGIASNHSDPEHWWSHFGYSMDNFRADVKKALSGNPVTVTVVAATPTLQMGSSGSAVTALQKRLNFMRIALNLAFQPLEEDGVFGAKTKEAVRAFQAARKLTVDGIAGPNTHKALGFHYGDVNNDGKVASDDALAVLRSAVGKQALTETQKQTADLNADGKTNATDAQEILKRTVKKR
ncbi:MAG: N-acetylmuramoyl-L-alanine amidase [Clostridia bacterium]|nr:N-acetylmuramoyl-L-alanine amidase [Clostridia bacterium]